MIDFSQRSCSSGFGWDESCSWAVRVELDAWSNKHFITSSTVLSTEGFCLVCFTTSSLIRETSAANKRLSIFESRFLGLYRSLTSFGTEIVLRLIVGGVFMAFSLLSLILDKKSSWTAEWLTLLVENMECNCILWDKRGVSASSSSSFSSSFFPFNTLYSKTGSGCRGHIQVIWEGGIDVRGGVKQSRWKKEEQKSHEIRTCLWQDFEQKKHVFRGKGIKPEEESLSISLMKTLSLLWWEEEEAADELLWEATRGMESICLLFRPIFGQPGKGTWDRNEEGNENSSAWILLETETRDFQTSFFFPFFEEAWFGMISPFPSGEDFDVVFALSVVCVEGGEALLFLHEYLVACIAVDVGEVFVVEGIDVVIRLVPLIDSVSFFFFFSSSMRHLHRLHSQSPSGISSSSKGGSQQIKWKEAGHRSQHNKFPPSLQESHIWWFSEVSLSFTSLLLRFVEAVEEDGGAINAWIFGIRPETKSMSIKFEADVGLKRR